MSMYGKLNLTVDCSDYPSMTKQANRDECDINKIIAKFDKTGMITHLSQGVPFYGDVSEFIDYREAVEMINKVDELFMGMSAEIRNRFDNDPQLLISFLNDPKNRKEAIELGIVNKTPEEVAKENEPSK